ncbi:suppressor of fused domain protein [Nocardia puris]|uniref:suppressor of fused domain protein n=1 Tax=Nocardia puris TaxID=208602 RepID=UPI0018935EB5|nr:suppressor of fused domain protein [Nocardia puris]MBF6211230.1 suppressor of fused domain protein [Nocardia puris]MBF6364949.1 suppressor of fused domain protein [Nocardia puris]MBF6458735.1 suppressor of fused domain protein [Nocardia puris]
MSDGAGWDAIDGALAQLYGGQAPVHWTVGHPWSLGGPDPLEGISAYRRDDPVPHWHYVGYGMSELGEKEWDDPEVSGWGFEFTFRLATDAEQPPVWPANFMQNLAKYVFQSGKWFEPGHTIKANGPIAADRPDSAIQAVGFVPDPELGTIATVNGRVAFLQIVGLTMTEYRAALGGKLLGLLDGLAPRLPLFVTDIDRSSLVAEPRPQATWPKWGGGLRGRP